MNSRVSKLHNLHQVVKGCQMIVCQRTYSKKFACVAENEFITEVAAIQPEDESRIPHKNFMQKVIPAKGCQVLIRLSEIARGSVSLHQLVVPVDGVSWSSFSYGRRDRESLSLLLLLRSSKETKFRERVIRSCPSRYLQQRRVRSSRTLGLITCKEHGYTSAGIPDCTTNSTSRGGTSNGAHELETHKQKNEPF